MELFGVRIPEWAPYAFLFGIALVVLVAVIATLPRRGGNGRPGSRD